MGNWTDGNRIALLLICALLAGCVSGGENPVPKEPDVGFAAYANQAAALHATWDAQAITAPTTLPLSGTARFDGVMGLRLATGTGELLMNGALRLNIDFATDGLSGQAGSFSDQSQNAVSGSLAITGGVLDRTANVGAEYTFSANIGGNLTTPFDSFAITGDINGDFSGASAGAVIGLVSGTAISSIGTGYVFGDFIAEQ